MWNTSHYLRFLLASAVCEDSFIFLCQQSFRHFAQIAAIWRNRLNEFISSVRGVIRPGGKSILRDHDVNNEDMRRTVALAHDTINAGIDESWQFNSKELRDFCSLLIKIDYLDDLGLKHNGQLFFSAVILSR